MNIIMCPGMLDVGEVKENLKKLGLEITEEQVKQLLKK